MRVKALLLLALAMVPAALATAGDTWTADLAGKTLPPGTTLAKGKGTGTMTITEQPGNLFFWEVDLFDVGKFSSVDLVLGTAGNPVVFNLVPAEGYLPDEVVYFGNFTRDYLDQQLGANGFDESALYGGDQLWALTTIVAPPNTAIGGQVTANAIADFNNTASSPEGAPEDTFELTSDSVYVAQMQNTTVPLFESGYTETNGTGSMILQDLKDGTFYWTLDTEFFRRPANLELRYFANLSVQPILLKLEPTPPLKDKVDAYEGNFTLEALNNALLAVGADKQSLERNFNVTPPKIFAKLDDTRNGSVIGFLFDANAEPTERPIIKSAAAAARAVAWTASAVAAALLLI